MLPLSSYEQKVLSIRRGKRPVILVNDPELIRVILGEKAELFVKSDVAVGALEPVVGSGLLISTGELWRRQRSMLDPALGRLRVRAMFPHMRARLDGFLRRLKPGEELSLESEIGILVFEIMCRSIFSTSLGASAALEMIEDLAGFQKLLPQLGPLTLFGFTDADDKTEEIRRRGKILRARIGALIDERLMGGAHNARDDILQAVIDARSSENAEFTREELIDHIMVFVFAGYDTTASALTWAFFILSQQSELVKELRQEVNGVAAGRDLVYEDIASLSLARMVFLETLRLYPPVAFLSRTALQKTLLGETVVEQGSLLVISPWVLHRHRLFWKSPEIFVPRRFSGDAERDINSGSFIPFGFGQRICPGRMVALTEGPFLISSILRHFDVEVANPAAVMPVSRITIRPNTQIDCRFRAVN